MKHLLLSTRAQTDLEEIWVFIAQDSPVAADRFVDRILETCRKLARAPRVGRSREDLAPGLRSLPFEKYIIFYRVGKPAIEIARVLSGFRDIDLLFNL